MRRKSALYTISDDVKAWSEGVGGKYFYYKKFLLVSRKSFTKYENHNPQRAKLNIAGELIQKILNKIISTVKFFVLLLRLGVCKKNKALVFNHTQRRRFNALTFQPLYVSSKLFDFERTIILDSSNVRGYYPESAHHFNIDSLVTSSSLVSNILFFFIRLLGRVKDKDMVDFFVKRKAWELLLFLLRPSRVVVLVWYGKEALLAACKNLNVTVCDLQHGIVCEGHPIYNISDGLAYSDSDYLLPNKCFVYGEYWKEKLISSGWMEENVSVLGYFLDVSKLTSDICKNPYILYTSQPTSNDIIIKHILSIEDELRRRGWVALIALHPADANGSYNAILSDVVKVSTVDSYDCLRGCEVHVSYSSTLLWESMIFNKSSYVLSFGETVKDLLNDFVDFGFGRPLQDGEFPEPFTIPKQPSSNFFFQKKINRSLIYDAH